MTHSLSDYHNYFLLWLELLLDGELKGRASDQTRVYDMGRIACDGLNVEIARERATEVLARIPDVLASRGFDCRSLDILHQRLESGRVPADDIIAIFQQERSAPATLRHLCDLH